MQLTERLTLILQAIKNYSVQWAFNIGSEEDGQKTSDQRIILRKLHEEHEFVNGIDVVYRALLQMQTIVSLSIQGELQTDQMQLTEAIVETNLKIEGDIGRRRTILNTLDFVMRSDWLIQIAN